MHSGIGVLVDPNPRMHNHVVGKVEKHCSRGIWGCASLEEFYSCLVFINFNQYLQRTEEEAGSYASLAMALTLQVIL